MIENSNIGAARLTQLVCQLNDFVRSEKTMTFGELYALYLEKRVRPRGQREDNAYYFHRNHGSFWANTPIGEIQPLAAQRWFDSIANESGRSGANRAVNMMRAVINWGMKRGYIANMPNPFATVELFREVARDRFLQPHELRRFIAALDEEPKLYHDIFWMLMLTGARRNNVLSMRWDDLDFDLRVWRIPRTKNGNPQQVPLGPEAISILQSRKACSCIPWVFPSSKTDSHVSELKRPFYRVLHRANIEGLRIHDLRRTLGSYMAIQGESGFVIAAALGHKDQRSTAVYARLNLAPVLNGMRKAHSAMFGFSDEIATAGNEQVLGEAQVSQAVQAKTRRPIPSIKLFHAERIVMNILRRLPSATRTDFHRAFGPKNRVTAKELDLLLESLRVRKLLKEVRSDDGQGRFCVLAESASARIQSAPKPRAVDALTKRQKEVLTLIIEGASNGAISQSLGISMNAVKACVCVVLRKLNVSGRKEAARLALSELFLGQ